LDLSEGDEIAILILVSFIFVNCADSWVLLRNVDDDERFGVLTIGISN
jgi:hypothetical protein